MVASQVALHEKQYFGLAWDDKDSYVPFTTLAPYGYVNDTFAVSSLPWLHLYTDLLTYLNSGLEVWLKPDTKVLDQGVAKQNGAIHLHFGVR